MRASVKSYADKRGSVTELHIDLRVMICVVNGETYETAGSVVVDGLELPAPQPKLLLKG